MIVIVSNHLNFDGDFGVELVFCHGGRDGDFIFCEGRDSGEEHVGFYQEGPDVQGYYWAKKGSHCGKGLELHSE